MNLSRQTIFQIIGLVLLSVIFFIPFILRSTETIPGSGDAFQVLLSPFNLDKNFDSFFSMISHRIVTEPIRVLYYTAPLFFFHTLFGEPVGYNIVWLLSFIGAALGTYLLVKHLTKNSWASLLAAVAYSFSPMHVAFSLGFGGATRIEWMPLLVLFVLKFFEKPKIRYAIIAAFFYLIIVVNEPHFALYSTIFILIMGGYILYRNPAIVKQRVFLWTSVAVLGLGASGLLTIYRDELLTTFSDSNYLNPGIEQTIYYSADLLGFFTPSPLHPIWGNFFQKHFESKFTGNLAERAVYIGFVVLFLFAVAIKYRKKLKNATFWIVNAAIFSILAMGPFLHVLGTVEPKIPLPYLLLYHYVPFFENIRWTGRIFIIASLCFAVAAGYGMKALMDRFPKTSKKRIIVPILLLGFLLIEFATKIPTSPIEPPAFYKQLANEPDDFAIMQPLITTTYPYATMAHYYNAYHNKKVIGSDFSVFVRPKEGALKFETETPVINELMHYVPFGQKQLNSIFLKNDYGNSGNFILNQSNIKYLILDKSFVGNEAGYITQENLDYYRIFIEQNFLVTKIEDDDQLLVYRIEMGNTKPLVMTLGENWHPLDVDANDKQEARWMANNSTLLVHNYGETEKSLRLKATFLIPLPDPKDAFKRMDVWVNEKRIGSYIIGNMPQTFEYFVDHIRPGDNTIRFEVFDNEGRSWPLYQPGTDGTETLTSTVLVKNVIMEEIESVQTPEIYSQIAGENVGIIQYPTQTTYSTSPVDLNNRRIGSLKVSGLDMFLQSSLDSETSSLVDHSNAFTLWPLMSNGINYDEVNANFDIFEKDYFKITGQNWIYQRSIRYVVIDKQALSPAGLNRYIDYLINNIWSSEKYLEDEQYVVFRIADAPYDPAILDMRIDKKWPALIIGADEAKKCPTNCREITHEATLSLQNHLLEAQSATASFSLGITRTVTLQVWLDDTMLQFYTLKPGNATIKQSIPSIPPGQHQLEFKVLDANGHPIESATGLSIFNLYI